jgi:hypothetical protein
MDQAVGTNVAEEHVIFGGFCTEMQTVDRRIIMKRLLVLVVLLGAAILITSAGPRVMSAPETAKKERATMKFDKPVMLMGTELKGTYLFVHDNEAMARGEACTFVYEGQAALPDKLVVSFHCTPKDRSKVTHFTVRTVQTGLGQDELTEFQFSGSTESHVVPAMVK